MPQLLIAESLQEQTVYAVCVRGMANSVSPVNHSDNVIRELRHVEEGQIELSSAIITLPCDTPIDFQSTDSASWLHQGHR